MAATATPTQTITTITPPSSSHGQVGGMWEYAVPLEHDETSRQTAKNPPHSVAASRRSEQTHRSNGTHARSTENLRAQQNGQRGAVEPEGAHDTYDSAFSDVSQPASYGPASRAGKKKLSAHTSGSVTRSAEDDADNWIHRDKLAQIESKELEAFRVGRRASERQDTSSLSKRQRLASPVHIEDDEETSTYDPYQDDPSSVTSKSYTSKATSSRAAGSRIPLPRGAATAGAQSDTDTVGQGSRSRTGSNGWAGSTAEHAPRSHSNSHSSSNDRQASLASPSTSPRKAGNSPAASSPYDASTAATKAATKSTTTTALRKVTSPSQKPPAAATKRAVSSGTKSTPDSKPASAVRDTTSTARPTTATHRPEGDPPWIVSMYKPDPRLPPDQQMLPTHAKRLAQEQWEKEGKTGTVYDREFKLLNSEPFPTNKRTSTVVSPSPDKPQSNDRIQETTLTVRWPLSDNSPLGSPRSQTSTRPGTSGTEHGGYMTVPNMTSPRHSLNANSPAVQIHPIRVQEVDESTEKKKTGCCACVVM